MMRNGLWICLLFYLFFTGCGLWPRETTHEDPRTRGENQFDPLGFPQDRVVVTEEEPGKKTKESREIKKDNEIIYKEPEGKESLMPQRVYRVQFFATKYPDEASEYKAPYYWVRLGDCETKEEADSLLEKIKKLGYMESWVVEIEIKP